MNFMIDKRFTLDTNVLVYAVDRDAGKKHEIAMEIIDKAMYVDCVLTVQVLAEFFSAATRKNYASAEQVSIFIKEWLNIFPVVGNSAHALLDALSTVTEHKLSFWDAMIWAAAKEAGCSTVISEDFQDGRELGGILFCNPFLEKNLYKLEEILKP
jgi:predicted nucleic acid-binding protein